MKSIVVLGHKDHGKSTFLGRLLYETNSVPVDKVATVKEIDAEAGREFEWAHLLDSFKEEREQEMTYDTASVFVHGKSETYMFIDVPGHSELVHQMLSGASKADRAILVVSAKEGIDAMSVKHLALAGFLGIKDLVVCINKMDSVGYEKGEFEKMKQAVEAEIKKTRFSSERVLFVPISAREGDNVSAKSSKMPWYAGPAVFAHIEEQQANPLAHTVPFRGLVQDVYEHAGKSMAMVVVKSGSIEAQSPIKAMPQGISFIPDELISSSGKSTHFAGTDENIGIYIDPATKIGRGTVFSFEHDTPVQTQKISSEIFLFKTTAAEPVLLECGGMRAGISGVSALAQEEILPVELTLDTPILFDAAETFLNKFVIKQKGDVIGVGRVISFHE